MSKALEVVEAEVVDLVSITEEIHAAQAARHQAENDVYEAEFKIGRLLIQARALHGTDTAFGKWFDAQEFGFSQRWARTLRRAAENEEAVKAEVGSQVPTGSTNLARALAAVVPPTPKALPSGKKSTKKSVEKKQAIPALPANDSTRTLDLLDRAVSETEAAQALRIAQLESENVQLKAQLDHARKSAEMFEAEVKQLKKDLAAANMKVEKAAKKESTVDVKKGAAVGRGPAPRNAPPPARSVNDCKHPINFRIGNFCPRCGKDNIK